MMLVSCQVCVEFWFLFLNDLFSRDTKTCWHSPGASCAFPSLSPCVTSNSVFYVAFSSGCYSSFVFTLLFISYHCCSLLHPNCFHLCLSFNQPRVCIHTLSHVPPSFSLVFVSSAIFSIWVIHFGQCFLLFVLCPHVFCIQAPHLYQITKEGILAKKCLL